MILSFFMGKAGILKVPKITILDYFRKDIPDYLDLLSKIKNINQLWGPVMLLHLYYI